MGRVRSLDSKVSMDLTLHHSKQTQGGVHEYKYYLQEDSGCPEHDITPYVLYTFMSGPLRWTMVRMVWHCPHILPGVIFLYYQKLSSRDIERSTRNWCVKNIRRRESDGSLGR